MFSKLQKRPFSDSLKKRIPESLNKYPSEDTIVKTFLEKQGTKPFIFANGNENISYDELLKNSNNEYIRALEGEIYFNKIY